MVEKVKKNEEPWSSADVVDFEYFLIHTSSRQNPTESAQQARHWFQQHVSDHSEEDNAELPDPKVLKAWLKHQKNQLKSELPLPGESWQWLIGMLRSLLVFVGLLSGAGVTAGLLKYDGVQPVNVAMFLCLLVGVQLIWSFASFILIAGKGLKWIPVQAGFSLRVFHSLLHWAQSRLHRHLISKLATEKRMVWESFWRHLRQDHGSSGQYLLWSILTRIQILGVMFNVGVILMFLVSVLFRDLAFGWQTSTQQINAETVGMLVENLSIPWNWIWGEGQGFPSLAQIEGSRIVLNEGIGSKQNLNLTSWWPFLLMAVFIYGFVPRVFLWIWLKAQEHRQLTSYPIESASCQNLWKRFHTPFLNVTRKPFDNHSQLKDGASASLLREESSKATSAPANPIAADIPCWIYMDEGLELTNDKGDHTSLLSPHGWQVKGWLDISPFDEVSPFEQFNKGDCLLWVEEAWQPPIQEKMNRLKKCFELLPRGVFFCIGLIGKPQGQSWLTPVRERDLEIWQKFVHQNLPEEVKVRTLVAS